LVRTDGEGRNSPEEIGRSTTRNEIEKILISSESALYSKMVHLLD